MLTDDASPPNGQRRNPAEAPPPSVPLERQIFAANFKRARLRAGLSQRDVQQQTGLAQSYISRVEKCLANISLDNMAKLAALVGIPLRQLLTPKRARKPSKK